MTKGYFSTRKLKFQEFNLESGTATIVSRVKFTKLHNYLTVNNWSRCLNITKGNIKKNIEHASPIVKIQYYKVIIDKKINHPKRLLWSKWLTISVVSPSMRKYRLSKRIWSVLFKFHIRDRKMHAWTRLSWSQFRKNKLFQTKARPFY